MKALLLLGAAPGGAGFGLLVLRITIGLSLIALHGWGKLVHFGARSATFPDPLGVGSRASLAFAVLGEVVAPLFVVLGLGTRIAAFVSTISMSVAFFIAQGGRLLGPDNGELAFVYMVAFAAIVAGGGGRYSLDARLAGGRA
jgi:putative oxidoreductase